MHVARDRDKHYPEGWESHAVRQTDHPAAVGRNTTSRSSRYPHNGVEAIGAIALPNLLVTK